MGVILAFILVGLIWTITAGGWLLSLLGSTDLRGKGAVAAAAGFIIRLVEHRASAIEYLLILLPLLILLGIVVGIILMMPNKTKVRIFSGQQGTAQWGEIDNLKQVVGEDGLVIGHRKVWGRPAPVRMGQRKTFEHIAVIGPTGCGKTSVFFAFNILTLPEKSSAVVTDPKGELAKLAEPVLRSRGFEVQIFRPSSDTPAKYDPLAIAKDEVEVAELAEITLRNGYSSAPGQVGDAQWVNFAVPLWEAVLQAQKQSGGSLGAAYDMVLEDERVLGRKMVEAGGLALARYKAFMKSLQSPETAGSIMTVLNSCVKLFGRPDVKAATAGKNGETILNPAALREKPTVLFVQIPERKAELLKPLSATLYWQLLEHIIDEDGLPVFFLLDEFPNLGKIPDFAKMAATVRSRRIGLAIGLQGIEQLSREYSREEQIDILNNMKTKIIFPGNTGETADFISKMAGYGTMKTQSASGKKGFGFGLAEENVSWQEQRREVMTPDEVRRIPEGKLVVLHGSLDPVMLEAIPYFKYRNLQEFVTVKFQ